MLLGSPVAHSRSPRIHRAALAACGIQGDYEPREVDATGFADACAELRTGVLDGANVTMPFKRSAFGACELLDLDARRAGAVNTLAVRDQALTGWNTDITAVRAALEDFTASVVLVLGAGGAAAAAAAAATGRAIRVAARDARAGEALAHRIGEGVAPAPWGVPVEGAVVVNATPLGMRGETLPPGVVEAAAGLIDLAYGPAETPAVTAARSRGVPAVDGIAVLVGQAAASFEIWTGVPAPRDAMERAARAAETLKTP